MTPEQKAELAAMMKQLAPNELRAIKYEANGGHKCTMSTNLITCCGQERCEACHIPHLKASHDKAKLYAFQKFYRAGTMTWPGYAPKKTASAAKVTTRTRTKRAKNEITKHFDDPTDIADRVDDDDLEYVLQLLASKLRK
jgi:hypothetical protein